MCDAALLLRSSASSSSLSHRLWIPRYRGGVQLRCCWRFSNQNWGSKSQRLPQLSAGHRRVGFQVKADKRAVNAMDTPETGKSSEVPATTIRVSEEMGNLEPKGPDADVRDGTKTKKSMVSKLGQRVNVAGFQFTSRIVLCDQHLAIPHINVPDIRWINWKALHDGGFEGVVFDKDNTLTAPHALAVWPALSTSIQECQTVFKGRIALLSNSAGLFQFDPDGAEAKALEERLGIPVIRHGTKKPAGTAEDLAKHFECDPSRLIMVGDRYFTDVVFGNNNGLLTIRPAPLTSVGEPFVVRKVRMFEDAAVRRWRRQKRSHRLTEEGYCMHEGKDWRESMDLEVATLGAPVFRGSNKDPSMLVNSILYKSLVTCLHHRD